MSLTFSVINKHDPQYFLTNVPDLELPLPVQFYSLYYRSWIPQLQASAPLVFVTEVGVDKSLKHASFPGDLTKVSHPVM